MLVEAGFVLFTESQSSGQGTDRAHFVVQLGNFAVSLLQHWVQLIFLFFCPVKFINKNVCRDSVMKVCQSLLNLCQMALKIVVVGAKTTCFVDVNELALTGEVVIPVFRSILAQTWCFYNSAKHKCCQ